MDEHQSLDDAEFKLELERAIPHLRAFGRSMSGCADTADDLVQDTMLKAWSARKRFIAGTSMRAWTFVILRNTFRSSLRRKKFTEPYDDAVAERVLSAPPSQQDPIHLADLRRALIELPTSQREAIILVGAGGYSYEDAAEISGCAMGTIKSRLSRARESLSYILESGQFRAASNTQDIRAENALQELLLAAEKIAS